MEKKPETMEEQMARVMGAMPESKKNELIKQMSLMDQTTASEDKKFQKALKKAGLSPDDTEEQSTTDKDENTGDV